MGCSFEPAEYVPLAPYGFEIGVGAPFIKISYTYGSRAAAIQGKSEPVSSPAVWFISSFIQSDVDFIGIL